MHDNKLFFFSIKREYVCYPMCYKKIDDDHVCILLLCSEIKALADNCLFSSMPLKAWFLFNNFLVSKCFFSEQFI